MDVTRNSNIQQQNSKVGIEIPELFPTKPNVSVKLTYMYLTPHRELRDLCQVPANKIIIVKERKKKN